MYFRTIVFFSFLLMNSILYSQKNSFKRFEKLSCAEKWWVIYHPFVAKKAFFVSNYVQEVTDSVKLSNDLNGNGNGDQIDAFRHVFWMASLKKEIGLRKSRRLGIAHEKGNKQMFKKAKLEEGFLPDKISCEMDLFNNEVGLSLEYTTNIKQVVVSKVKNGSCKIIKKDRRGNFLDKNNQIIISESLKGKWENNKCLVKSDY